jgi:hypothetical protein
VFTARYALSPYMKQIRLVFKVLKTGTVNCFETFAIERKFAWSKHPDNATGSKKYSLRHNLHVPGHLDMCSIICESFSVNESTLFKNNTSNLNVVRFRKLTLLPTSINNFPFVPSWQGDLASEIRAPLFYGGKHSPLTRDRTFKQTKRFPSYYWTICLWCNKRYAEAM